MNFVLFYRVDEEEIEKQCDELRQRLTDEMNSGKRVAGSKRNFKEHQVHEMADAKIKESERLRKALKIRSDYEEGSHWNRQEERLRDKLEKEADREEERSKQPVKPGDSDSEEEGERRREASRDSRSESDDDDRDDRDSDRD